MCCSQALINLLRTRARDRVRQREVAAAAKVRPGPRSDEHWHELGAVHGARLQRVWKCGSVGGGEVQDGKSLAHDSRGCAVMGVYREAGRVEVWGKNIRQQRRALA